MPWKVSIDCHVSHVAGGNSHVVVWDGLEPPEADRPYCFRCPVSERLQLVDPNRHRWTLVEERVIHRVTLYEHRPIQLLEFGDAQPY